MNNLTGNTSKNTPPHPFLVVLSFFHTSCRVLHSSKNRRMWHRNASNLPNALPFDAVQTKPPTRPPIRVLVAKVGLDGHDRGAKVIAHALRDAGMEVLYTGLRKTPESIVHAAIQEDVDCIGLSILSGAHNTLVPRLLDLLKQQKAEDILVVLGGTIPQADIPALKQQGVAQVFGPGTPLDSVVDFLREHVKPRTAELA